MNARPRPSTTWPLLLAFAALAACSRTETGTVDAARPDVVSPDTPGLDADDAAPDVAPPPDASDEPAPPPDALDAPPLPDVPDEPPPPPPDVMEEPPPPDAPSCVAPRQMCSTGCADLATDPSNCGACGNLCPAGRTCTAGRCGCSCAAGLSVCGADCRCIDLQNDAANCGRCGNDCNALPGVRPGAARCAAGVCDVCAACVAGRGACGTASTGCTTDLGAPANCGACGRTCPAATPLCAMMAGGVYACTSGCPATAPDRCGMACVDLQRDANNCGRCGNRCPGTSNGIGACEAGACTVSCASGFHRCATSCPSNASVFSCGPTSCSPCPAPPANATATCDGTACGFACNAGFHRCGGACVANTSVATCGASCTPCTAPAGTTPTCDGTSCGFTCPAGQHRCGALCVANTAVSSCGPTSCSPCPTPVNGTATCDGTTCGAACSAGFHACAGACVANAAVATCGASCTPCPAPANGTATCNGTACGVTCNAGFHACGAACAADTSPATCGASCTPCTAPANATATCTGTACDFACNAGFSRVGTACVAMGAVAPPRPVWPPSTATATIRRPTFQWALAAGSDGARVQVCRDRACATVLATFDATGATGAPAADLPTGVVFWRLLGRAGATTGTAASVPWELTVPARSAALGTAWGSVLDANGDGLGDVLAGAPGVGGGTGRSYIHPGQAGIGVAAAYLTRLTGLAGANAYYGNAVASAGDVNGDGYADVLIGSYLASVSNGRVDLYFGGPGGPGLVPSNTALSPDAGAYFGYAVAAAGDVNRDGYGDIVVGGYLAAGAGRAYVFYGSAGGITARPSLTLNSPSAGNASFGYAVAGAGDVNGDGYADVVVGANGVGTGAGAAYVYLGGAAGLAATPAVSLTSAGGAFGTAVGCAGDVNGDGYADVAVGAERFASNAGRAYVFLGRAGGPAAAPSFTLASPSAGGFFGTPATAAGDVNGDGYGDLLVGAQNANGSVGQAHIFHGSAAGVALTPSGTLTGPDGVGGAFGYGAAGAGDVNADGFGDVVVGAFTAAARAGRVHVYLGSAAGVRSAPQVSITGPDGAGALYGTACD
ncbi:MAG: FG-GAP-like repeat-containing protein [Polyangiales bacterium]